MDAAAALCALLRHAGVHVDPIDVTIELRSQPSPALVAIVRALDGLGIGHVAASVSLDALADVAPAIAHTEAGLVLVESAAGSRLTVLEQPGRRRAVDRAAFAAAFTGTVVFLDGERRETHERRRLERARHARLTTTRAIKVATLVWIACLTVLGREHGVALALLALNLLGLGAAGALVGLGLGVETALGRSFCPGDRRGEGCQTVLRSSLARPFGVNLSEIGLCAFIAQHLALAFALAGHEGVTVAVGAASVLALVVPLLALGAQALVVRAWCRLCLVVQAALVAQGTVALLWLDAAALDAPSLVTLAACAALAAGAWLVVRRWLILWSERIEVLSELARLRRAPARISALLEAAEPLELGELPGDIVRGPKGAPVRIDLVTSLECDGCRIAFLELDDLLGRFGDLIRARVRFHAAPRAEPARRAADRAIGHALRGDGDRAWSALARHFEPERDDVDGPSTADEGVSRVLEEHTAWCRQHEVRVTPARAVNGRQLDPGVAMRDLADLVEGLA